MSAAKSPKNQSESPAFIFGRMNYLLMIAGIVLIIIGFLLMTGGAPDNPAIFNPDEKYSFRRITLGPIVILIGLAIEFLSILVKARE